MNKRISIILCALVATLSSHVNAELQGIEVDGLYFSRIGKTDQAILIPKYKYGATNEPCQDITGAVVIPSTVVLDYDKYTVTSIDAFAFKNCTYITSITIPSTIKSIGANAIEGCYSLKSITIPGTLTTIGSDSFRDCPGLESVYVEEDVETIDQYSFYNCKNLTTISIPSSVNYIGKEAFNGCSKLKNVIINNSISNIKFDKNSKVFDGIAKDPNLYIPKQNYKQNYSSNTVTFGYCDFNAIPFVGMDYNTPYGSTEEASGQCVIYYRDFAGIENWQALYVPFTSDYSEWEKYFIIADLVNWQEGDDQDVLCWYELGEHNQVSAGHPYIIKRRKNTENTGFVKLPADMQSFRIFNNKGVTKSDEHHPVTIDKGVYGYYTLAGTYSGVTPSDVTTTGDFYALGMDGNFVQAPEGTNPTLSANRIYLISQKKNSAQANQAPFRMSFLEEDPGEPSSIDDCVAIEQPDDDTVYDLYGRRVANPKSGIYIKNGRKFIIK